MPRLLAASAALTVLQAVFSASAILALSPVALLAATNWCSRSYTLHTSEPSWSLTPATSR